MRGQRLYIDLLTCVQPARRMRGGRHEILIERKQMRFLFYDIPRNRICYQLLNCFKSVKT